MRDDRRPIVCIFTTLFFIEADYITTLFDPNLLDLKRSRILCSGALWNTFEPAGTTPKH